LCSSTLRGNEGHRTIPLKCPLANASDTAFWEITPKTGGGERRRLLRRRTVRRRPEAARYDLISAAIPDRIFSPLGHA
jgi:hypothetical protein